MTLTLPKYLPRRVLYLNHCIRNLTMESTTGKIMNINSKHLKTGDSLPPYKSGLRVYNMRYCPYAQRAILALNAKNVTYDVVNCNLLEKPEWLFAKSNFGKVPALEIEENVTLYESLVVVEYIDDIYPEINRLLPTDPLRRAQDKMIVQHVEPAQRAFFIKLKMPEKFSTNHIDDYHKSISKLQTELTERGTEFFHGNVPGYVDYMIWPWLERWPVLAKYVDKSFELSDDKYKKLNSYTEKMKEVPAVKSYLIDEEVHWKYFQYMMKGENRYDFLDE